MRLTKEEKEQINTQVKQIFGESSRTYLFGSRVSDEKKGGDIDLFIEPQNIHNEFEQKIILLTRLQLVLGDQKIDIVLSVNPNRLIEQEARKNGELL
ncbi:MAG: nucleotidyltransferase domain-containing protein [Legionellales bacterium]